MLVTGGGKYLVSTDFKFHLLQSRVLILPSFAEELPVFLIESLALDRPAMSTYTLECMN